MEIPVNERFEMIFKEYQMSMYEVGQKLGVNSSRFSKLVKGTANPSFDTIQDFLRLFPDLSLDFIMRGTLPVRVKPNATIIGAVEWVSVPFVPVKAYATFTKNYSDGYKLEDLDTIMILSTVLEEFLSKQLVVIEVDGNSMAPQLPDRAKVLASYVSPSDWVYASSGVYAVLYRDYFVAKRIRQNNLMEKGFLDLYSDNELYGMMTVNGADIRGIWKVLRVVDSRIE